MYGQERKWGMKLCPRAKDFKYLEQTALIQGGLRSRLPTSLDQIGKAYGRDANHDVKRRDSQW
jgi:hypothetical protein